MAGLGCGHDALVACEQDSGLKALDLVVGDGLHQAQFLAVRDQGGHAMVAQTTGMKAWWRELAAQRMHLGQGCHAAGVAKVVGVFAARQ